MTDWVDVVVKNLAENKPLCHLVIAQAKGSTPREEGATMLVGIDDFTGTIGGGQIEHTAMKVARDALKSPPKTHRFWRDYPLGPTLGQCCGGFVTVMFEMINPQDIDLWKDFAQQKTGAIFHPEDPSLSPFWADNNAIKSGMTRSARRIRTPFYLYGAGHVGRAVIDLTSGLPLQRYWIDDNKDRYPESVADDIEIIIAASPALIARHALPNAIHLVMTYSHQIDLDICAAVLEQDNFSQLGLIGSLTKKNRFCSKLSTLGFSAAQLSRLTCPIGLQSIGGKDPFRVGLSIAGQLSEWTRKHQTNHNNNRNYHEAI